MSDNKDFQDNENSFDGIKELDNPMPAWWFASFLVTIIFSALYYMHYTSGAGESIDMEFARQWEKHNSEFQGKTSIALSDEELYRQFEDQGLLAMGAEVYQRSCQSCHGDQLQGLVGPNLVDNYWLHGRGKPSDIVTTISEGVLDKGMPAWGPVLKKEEIVAVAALIHSKRGANVPNPKPPQGELVAQ